MPTTKAAVIAIALSLSLTMTARAEVFKCSSTDGKVEYRDKPCVNGIVSKRIPLAPAPTQTEVYAAQQVANKNASALTAARVVPTDGFPVFMGKMINQMKMNDIQRNESLRQGEKKK